MSKDVKVHFDWAGAKRILLAGSIPWFALLVILAAQDMQSGKWPPPAWVLIMVPLWPAIVLGLYCLSSFLVALASEPDPQRTPPPRSDDFNHENDDVWERESRPSPKLIAQRPGRRPSRR